MVQQASKCVWFTWNIRKLRPDHGHLSELGPKLAVSHYLCGGAWSNGKVMPPLWEATLESVCGSGVGSLFSSSPGPGSLGTSRFPAEPRTCVQLKDKDATRCKRLDWPREVSVASYFMTWSPPSLVGVCFGKSGYAGNCQSWLGYAVRWHFQPPVRDHLASPCRWRRLTFQISLTNMTLSRHKLH